MKKELKARQIALFFIAFLPIVKLFNMPKIAAGIAEEDMWLSVLLNLTADFLTVLALIFVNDRHNKPVEKILEDAFGRTATKIIGIIYVIYFLIKAFNPIYEIKSFIQYALYETTPTAFIFLPFFILSFYFCTTKLRAVGRLADISWAFTVTGILFLIALSVENVDVFAILPVGANFNKILPASRVISPYFTDAGYFLFLIGNFDKEEKSTAKILAGFGVHALLTVVFSLFFYCTFTFVAKRELFALAEVAKYSNVINTIGRFDYLAILLILLSGTVSMTLPLYFATIVINRFFNVKRVWITSLAVNLLLVIPIEFLRSDCLKIAIFINDYLSIFTFLMGNVIPLSLLFIKRRKNEVYSC